MYTKIIQIILTIIVAIIVKTIVTIINIQQHKVRLKLSPKSKPFPLSFRNQSSKILDNSTTTSLKKRESRQTSTGSKSLKNSKKSAVEKFDFDSEGEDDDEEEEQDGGDGDGEEGEEGREGSDEGEGDEGREGGRKGKRMMSVGGGKDKGKGGVKAGAAAGRGGGGGGSGGRMTGSNVKDKENEGDSKHYCTARNVFFICNVFCYVIIIV